MKRVYTIVTSNLHFLTPALLVILFFFSQPRISSTFPFHYTQFQQKLLDELQQTQTLDAKKYWEFREFYSLGNFSFDPTVVDFGETQIITELVNQKNILLKYDSPRLQSTDYLVKIPDMSIPHLTYHYLLGEQHYHFPKSRLIFNNDSTRLLETTDGKYVLIFVKSLQEMKKVNGFFNYQGNENWITRDTVWLNVTTFW